jgi:hypothetical protein
MDFRAKRRTPAVGSVELQGERESWSFSARKVTRRRINKNYFYVYILSGARPSGLQPRGACGRVNKLDFCAESARDGV